MSEKLTVVYTTAEPYQARELTNLLAEAGIEAIVLPEACQNGAREGGCCASAATRIAVGDADADRARRIAEDFQAQTQSVDPAAGPEDQPLPAERREAVMASWPQCPNCRRPRHTCCPICGTAGDDFVQADPEFAGTLLDDDPAAMVVVCPTCDEPFVPRFLRCCEWCGHDFGEGEEPVVVDTEELSGRAVVLILVIAAMLVVLVAYYMWLL